MMRKTSIVFLTIILLLSLTACQTGDKYKKYEADFFDSFDTHIRIVAYSTSQQEFDKYVEDIHARFMHLHKLYDKYNNYEGINNIKTINDEAGQEAVEVDDEIIEMLLFSKEWYEKAGPETNVALGSLISIWGEARDQAEEDPDQAKLPDQSSLEEAILHTDINKVRIDIESKTVYLEDENMSLDVGAVAKGYATEIVAQEVEAAGLESAIINAGGNIRVIGKPLDGKREKWGIGIQNPDPELIANGSNILDVVYGNNLSVVTSGDYQRNFTVDGKIYHHIIDPKSLYPGDYYKSVTIVTADSGLADFLSTSVFLLPYNKGKELVDDLEGVEALWVMKDGTIEFTAGMKTLLESQGADAGK